MLKYKCGFYIFAILFAFIVSPSQGLAAAAAPKAKIIVAKSGGNYTTITAALNAITPSASNPYIIEVWPGTYAENITMKSYVTLQGSGTSVTVIRSPTTAGYLVNVIEIGSLTGVSIAGFTITGSGGYGAGINISTGASSVSIRNNTITGNIFGGITTRSPTTIMDNTITSNGNDGISFDSAQTIRDNIISNNGSDGIDCYTPDSEVIITGNTISGNSIHGVQCNVASMTFTNNTVTGNGGTTGSYYAVQLYSKNGMISGNKITDNKGHGIETGSWWGGLVTVTDNKITGNGGTGIFDNPGMVILHNNITNNGLDVSANNLSSISFNVFDTTAGVVKGAYNLKSDATPWP
ncbi:MAG: pectinesterase family protein [Gallionellaceae bacterium]|nr:pectinesterase family protein [Gallionellaceae bacterium]